jgi:uncharacterized membrane protein YbhN (UPF0104 family)
MFLAFVVWKSAQLVYNLTSSILAVTIFKYYRGQVDGQAAKSAVTVETVWSFAGQVISFYFIVLLCLYCDYLRRLNKYWAKHPKEKH